MTLTITKGMAGKRIETIGKYTSDEIDQMFVDFFNWKKNASHEKYHISSYERHLFNDNEHKVIIDFGDYLFFALIKTNAKEWKVLMSHRTKPIDLEV